MEAIARMPGRCVRVIFLNRFLQGCGDLVCTVADPRALGGRAPMRKLFCKYKFDNLCALNAQKVIIRDQRQPSVTFGVTPDR